MPGEVSPQVDIGALGLTGAGALTSIVAILSADNVAPAALVQLERLGAVFPTSGPVAEQVKGLLQRCSGTTFNKLGVMVGWRKNDASSLMGRSAGGLAISLLCLCLTYALPRHEEVGFCLSRLCASILSRDNNIASVSQLANAAEVLATKLGAVGIGNLIAQEALKLSNTFESMSHAIPKDLLELIEEETMTEFLQDVSTSLLQDRRSCRISGAGLVVGLFQVLFHNDLSIVLGGKTVQQALKPKIIIEFIGDANSQSSHGTKWRLETLLDSSQGRLLPLKSLSRSHHRPLPLEIGFKRDGWCWDYLNLGFASHGLRCPSSVISSCRQMAIQLNYCYQVGWITLQDAPNSSPYLRPRKLTDLLGPQSSAKIHLYCETLSGSESVGRKLTLKEASDNVVEALETAILIDNCESIQHSRPCNWSDAWQSAWPKEMETRRRDGYSISEGCEREQLCRITAFTVTSAIVCFFVKAGPDVTLCPRGPSIFKPLVQIGHDILRGKPAMSLTTDALWACICSLTTGYKVPELETPEAPTQVVAHRSATSTCCASILHNLAVTSQQGISFDLLEGLMIFEGRNYRSLETEESTMEGSKYELRYDQLTLSDTGTPDHEPLITLWDGFNTLILGCSAGFQGTTADIVIWSKIRCYPAMYWCDSCSYPLASPLNYSEGTFMEMCVAMPMIEEGHIGIFMMRKNPIAQFFACDDVVQSVLVRDCCPQCATKHVKPGDYVAFIVG